MIVRFIQLLIVLSPVAMAIWLLLIDITPSGERTVRYEVGEVNPYVQRPLPDDRLRVDTRDGERVLVISGNPVYFSVLLPQTEFKEVDVAVEFQNGGQPVFEVGGLVDVVSEAYDLQPMHNLVLEKSDWSRLANEDGLFLLQKSSKYNSIEEFLAAPPAHSAMALYRYDVSFPFRFATDVEVYRDRQWATSLRGAHTAVTYLRNSGIDLTVRFMDMNRTFGSDEVKLILRNEFGDIVEELRLEDDGNETLNQAHSTREITLQKSRLPEGVYTIEFLGTSDIFWRNIVTNTRYFSWKNKFYIGDSVGYLAEDPEAVFYTDAKQLTLETFHATSADEVVIGNSRVLIPENHTKVTTTVREEGILRGVANRGDVRMAGNGFFSFEEDAFFNPYPIAVDAYTDLEASSRSYVLANYTPPERIGAWLKGSATFELSRLYRDDDALKFVLSVPRSDDLDEEVVIRAIEVTYRKPPVTTLSGMFAEVRSRLPFGL